MTEFCDCIFRFLKSSQNGAACTLMQVRQERRVFCRIHLCDQTEVDDEDAAHGPSDGGEMKWQKTMYCSVLYYHKLIHSSIHLQ